MYQHITNYNLSLSHQFNVVFSIHLPEGYFHRVVLELLNDRLNFRLASLPPSSVRLSPRIDASKSRSRYKRNKYEIKYVLGFFFLDCSPMVWVSQYREMRMTNHGVTQVVVTDVGNDQQVADQVNRVPVCLTQANTNASVTFFLLLVLLFFVAPFVILVVLYSFIVNHLIRDSSGNTSDSYHSRARRQVVYMLLTIVISFFVCLSPYRLLIFYIVIAPVEEIAAIDYDTFFGLLNFCRIMFYLNSAGNPILYNLMSSKFRRGFLKLCGFAGERGTHLRSTIVSARRITANQQEDLNQEENFLWNIARNTIL